MYHVHAHFSRRSVLIANLLLTLSYSGDEKLFKKCHALSSWTKIGLFLTSSFIKMEVSMYLFMIHILYNVTIKLPIYYSLPYITGKYSPSRNTFSISSSILFSHYASEKIVDPWNLVHWHFGSVCVQPQTAFRA